MNAAVSARVASVRFRAIGAKHQILATDAASLDAAKAFALDHLDQLDAAASRFRENSEVCRLAARPGRDPLQQAVWAVVSPLLASYLVVALTAARSTNGLVDPTTGAAARASGYDADLDVVRARQSSPTGVATVPGWRTIQFDPDSRLLGVVPGTLLDLGATAKAYAAETIARELADRLPGGFLVNLGGDIALVASSTRLRRWRTADAERHHIIDPRTGGSAPSTWAQVTCAAPTAVAANTVATAAIVLGADVPSWLRGRGVAARSTASTAP